jgi:phage baseplate assembly protein W
MTTFIGFNTINQVKKFTLTGYELIKQDLLNAFNIRQGELPGRPAYGTVMWTFLFENQLENLVQAIRAEIQRVAGQDPRISISDLEIYPQDNGILVQVNIQVVPSQNAERLAIFFDQLQRNATFV